MVMGLVRNPKVYTMDDIMRLPSVSRIHFIECGANSAMEFLTGKMPGGEFVYGTPDFAATTLRHLLREGELVVGVGVTFVTAAVTLAFTFAVMWRLDPWLTVLSMAALPFLGMAMLCSMNTGSAMVARACAQYASENAANNGNDASMIEVPSMFDCSTAAAARCLSLKGTVVSAKPGAWRWWRNCLTSHSQSPSRWLYLDGCLCGYSRNKSSGASFALRRY